MSLLTSLLFGVCNEVKHQEVTLLHKVLLVFLVLSLSPLGLAFKFVWMLFRFPFPLSFGSNDLGILQDSNEMIKF